MIENVSSQLTVFHCFAHCLLPGRAFASLYVLLFLEKEAEIGGRVLRLGESIWKWIVGTGYAGQVVLFKEKVILMENHGICIEELGIL